MKINDVIGKPILINESADFPPKSIVPTLAKEMFDTGMMVHHGSSLDDFINDYHGEPWWDENLSYEEIVSSEKFRKGFVDWLYLRYEFAKKEFQANVTSAGGWPIPIIRAMVVSEEWIKNINPNIKLGKFWAVYIENYKAYIPYGSDPFAPGIEIYLHTHASPKNINWLETLKSRMDYSNGDVEMEIQLKEGTKIALEYIEDENGDPVPFTKGMYRI